MPKEIKLVIEIKRSASDVFQFTTNPQNTPLWIDSIVVEKASEFPPKTGTVYKNKGSEDVWSTYVVVDCQPDKLFELAMTNSDYHVRYTYTPLDAETTLLEYFEWVDQGELQAPFTNETLQKLKKVIEA